MDNSLSVYEVQILNTNTGCFDVFLVTAISITFAYINFSETFEEDFHDDGNVKVIKLEEF
ncbi:hypothetical protein [Enterococcus phage UTI-EfS7]|uniref:Uncharacterized protein n=1 Tax=Enterococcus phage PMBT56 TaxID=3229530 RepID=A0AB39C6B7_9CAUD|nr:hypothetical protein [Enterococcus phage UTI-EfS7]